MPASRPMPRPLLLVGRELRAALVIGEGAARCKRATGREIVQRRHHAGNFLQPLDRIGGSSTHDLQTRDRCQQTVSIGVKRLSKQSVDFGLFNLSACVHDNNALRSLGDDTQIVRDQDDRGAELLLQFQDQVQDLRLDRHVQGSCRLVGDQHPRVTGQRHRDHRPLPHAAGQLVRIFAGPLCRLGDLNQPQHFHRLIVGGALREILMEPQRLGDLVADRQHRIERGHRLLKDHRDLVAADVSHLGFFELYQVLSIEGDRAADDLSGWVGDQAHDRQRGHGLAAAGLANHRQRLAPPQREGDVVDRFHDPRTSEEVGAQTFDIDDCRGVFAGLRGRIGRTGLRSVVSCSMGIRGHPPR